MPALTTFLARLTTTTSNALHDELTTLGLNDAAKISVLFAILIASLVAVSFPAISSAGFIRLPDLLFFIGKHLGTGVILATAFIHLLPDSFDALLSSEVKERYGNVGKWTGLMILASLLAIFLVEYVSTTYVDRLQSEPSAPPSPNRSPSTAVVDLEEVQETPVILPFLANSPKIMRLRSNAICVCTNGVCVCAPPSQNEPHHSHQIQEHHHDHHHHHEHELRQVGRRRQIVGIFVLQVGIMIHSLVIGLTLSVTSGADFTSLTTAVLFHQLFEGLSLGIRISALPQAKKGKKSEERDDEEDAMEAPSPRLVHGDIKPRNGKPVEDISVLLLDNDGHASCSTPTSSSRTPLLLKPSNPPLSRAPKRQEHCQQGRPTVNLQWRGWESLRNIFHRDHDRHPHSHEHSVSSTSGGYGSVSIPSSPDDDSHNHHHHSHPHTKLNALQATLSLLFAVTTPIGMGIGMIVLRQHSLADEAVLKLIQGVMSAISAGMLIYVATVEMIGGDFVFGDVEGGHHHGHAHGHHHHHEEGQGQDGEQEHNHPQASVKKKALAVVSLLAGVGAMVLIGLGEGDH